MPCILNYLGEAELLVAGPADGCAGAVCIAGLHSALCPVACPVAAGVGVPAVYLSGWANRAA